MQRKYFGTDGIRGTSNTGFITPELMIKLARATCIACGFLDKKPTIVIGKDTRLSGYMLEFALTSGFISMGANIVLAGPVPTPAVSMLVRSLRADLGMMISASHNPYFDNGVKFFDAGGYKISHELEEKIEQLMHGDLGNQAAAYNALGKATKLDDARGRYIEYVKNSFPSVHKLDGIKIVVDCANGAAYDVAPKVFRELGAEVVSLAIAPNGFNINKECGATNPKNLSKAVLEHRADIGIALDGDADRIIIVDEKGRVLDGDQIIAALSSVQNDSKIVVATIMSNIGLENYLKTIGVDLIRTKVGDKYVVEKMRELGGSLGGEQSGHIIVGSDQATGDGIRVALQLLALYIKAGGAPISQVINKFIPVPQYIKNIKFTSSEAISIISDDALNEIAITAIEKLGSSSRIVLRKSGTEPLIRIMIESADEKLAQDSIMKIEEKIVSLI